MVKSKRDPEDHQHGNNQHEDKLPILFQSTARCLGYPHKERGRQRKRHYQHGQAGHLLIIDDAPRASEVAKKHDKKDGD